MMPIGYGSVDKEIDFVISGGVEMNVIEAIYARRTVRKFTQEAVPTHVLRELVDCARVGPCSANMQPLKYKLVEKADVDTVFPYLRWAVAIAPEGDPAPEERPTAYIIIAADTSIRPQNYEIDVGIAAQTMALAAQEKGLGVCLMALHDKPGLKSALALPEQITPALAVALGYPAQKSEIYPMEAGQYRYHLTPDGTLHVPKRSLDEILL